ncbi:MAG: ABC transporter transmembrane domain-containing protein, partial [Acidobacteriota bacterium]
MNPHEEEILGKAYDARLMRRLLTYIRPYRTTVLVSIALIFVVAALDLAGPYLMKVAIDDYIATGRMDGLHWIALLNVAALLAHFGFSYLQSYLMNVTGQRIMYDLRMQIFTHFQRLQVSFFDRNPVGRLITRVTTDVDVLNEMFTSGVVAIFGDVFTLFGIIVVLFWLDFKLALVTLSVVPLLFVITWVFKVKVRASYRRVRTAIARINAFLQENIVGMSVVQLFVQENRRLVQFRERNEEHRQANLQSVLYYSVFYPLTSLVGAVAIALIIWYGGGQALRGALTLGVLVAFIQYSERFYKPIMDLSEKFNILQGAMASSERIFKLLDTPVTIESHGEVIPGGVRGEIEFDHVWFSYKENEPVLKDVSFQIQPGESVALVGATGA